MSSVCINQIINEYLTKDATTHQYSISEVNFLCDLAKPLLLNDSSLLEISVPVSICGDIHGQIDDLIRIIKLGKCPPTTKWLFLGDYVDRGKYSLDVICFLLALKIQFPSHVFLLRGNHEHPAINKLFGFYEECIEKVDLDTWNHITDIFQCLPFAALIENSYFCVHGGISPFLDSVSQIQGIQRPIESPLLGLIADLLWSDPDKNIHEFADSPRGNSFIWGIDSAERFIKNNNLLGIIRAHQMVPSGYDYPFGTSSNVVTIFSAPDYNKEIHNNGAFLTISGIQQIKIEVIKSQALNDTTIENSQSWHYTIEPPKSIFSQKNSKVFLSKSGSNSTFNFSSITSQNTDLTQKKNPISGISKVKPRKSSFDSKCKSRLPFTKILRSND